MKPICLERKCCYYDTDPSSECCVIFPDDTEDFRALCPCENGEFEEMFGIHGELYEDS